MKAADLRSKSVDELGDELVALRREQFNLRMQQARGELTHSARAQSRQKRCRARKNSSQ